MTEPSGWIIDVCATCHRLATWPFCEHRPKGYVPPGTPPWCVAISVVPTRAARARLLAIRGPR